MAATMRHFFTCTLLVTLAISALAQNTLSLPQKRRFKRSDQARNSAQVNDWADRVTSNDPKVRAAAEAGLVKGAGRSLPLLRRFLASDNEYLHEQTFEIIRRIGPPAIPLLVELLRDEQVSFRRFAVDASIDLAPDTEPIQPALRRALRDDDSMVAGDAARALGALRQRASPSVGALVKALAHEDVYVRIYAAEALASIGPKAGAATNDLARALGDPIPGVRWAAGEALGGIGPAAQSAVPQLVKALKDEFLYVRICAAEALGSLGNLGPQAQSAVEALRAAANDPALRTQAEWALSRIGGINSGKPVDSPKVAGPSVSLPPQTVAQTGNPPIEWDTTTGRNIVWSVELGNEVYGSPVVSGDVVYVGADNTRQLNPAFKEDSGTLRAFRVTDGAFLWQDVAPRVERGLRDWLLPSTTSIPYVEGDRLYYVTAECQFRSLDTKGFGDGNDGPYREEVFKDKAAADVIWQLDMPALGVFPHEACNSEVLPLGDLLLVGTSNGQNEAHTRVPSPRAPSLIAVNKHTGEVVWSAIGPGDRVLHGNWSSPVAANVEGHIQVLYGGGDGWLRAYDAASGQEIWRFDGNPKDARWLPRAGVLSRSYLIASPVFADGRVFIAMGQSPGHFNAPSLIHAISPNGQGDVTKSGLLWTSREVGRVVATPIVKDGLLYIGDLGGTVHCLDAATGAQLWTHETNGPIWGCFLLAGDRLYVGNDQGVMTVLRAGRRKEVLAEIEMNAALYSRPAVIGDALYLATATRLYRIAAKLDPKTGR